MAGFPVLVNGRFLTQRMTGVQRHALEITRQLVSHFPDLEVCAPPGEVSSEHRAGLPVEPCGRLRGHLWEQLELPRRAGRDEGTVLINLCNTGPLGTTRQIITLHDLGFLHQPGWYSRRFYYLYRFLIPRLAKRSARIVTDSEFSRREILERLDVAPERVHVVHCAVSRVFGESSGERAESRPSVPRPYIVAVSSLDPRKNLERLILAFRELGLPDLELRIVGASSRIFARSGLKSLADSVPGVRLCGYVSDEDLAELYRGARLSVFPSLYEGFGLPPLEGMACGCPAVVSSVASLPEVCGDAAHYVDPSCVEDIARGIGAVLGDEGLREDLRCKGRDRSRSFSWERSGAALARIVREVGEG